MPPTTIIRLRLVLTQSMRQDAVASGSVSVQIEGARENRPVELTLAEWAASQRASGQLPFQFRYFQNLEQDVGAAGNGSSRAP